jgi:hypothetical protein
LLTWRGGGRAIGPPLFERPVAHKVMTLKKFRKISCSTEIILKLSFAISSKKLFYTSNSLLSRPNTKFWDQNVAVVMSGNFRNPQLKVSYVTAGDIIAPPPFPH